MALQLQHRVCAMSEAMFTALGWLQSEAPPFESKTDTTPVAAAAAATAAAMVADAWREVDKQISMLPGAQRTQAEQLATLQQLDAKNVAEGEALRKAITDAEKWQMRVRALLVTITDDSIQSIVAKKPKEEPKEEFM
ncbi:hypothetical protein Pelo_9796 [Pelomyxa schiedti]|nr:hypothetical protein Pelo_9796 [Pelomyxa schiedti]